MRELETADDVYETFGAMMRFIAAAPSAEPWLRQINDTCSFSLTDPEAQVTCSFPAEGPLQVEFGPSKVAANTTISIGVADVNTFMLGELNVFLEIDQGTVLIEGSPIAFMLMIPRMKGFPALFYRQVLQADARDRSLLFASGERDDQALVGA